MRPSANSRLQADTEKNKLFKYAKPADSKLCEAIRYLNRPEAKDKTWTMQLLRKGKKETEKRRKTKNKQRKNVLIGKQVYLVLENLLNT